MPLLSLRDREKLEQAVAELRAGSEEAFEFIYNSYFTVLVSFAVMKMKDGELSLEDYKEIAKDIVAQVFHHVWLKHTDFPSVSKLEGFLQISIRNHVLNYIHHRKVRRRYKRDYAPIGKQEMRIEMDQASDKVTDDRWAKIMLHYDIYAEIQKLRPQEQKVLLLRLQCKEVEDIAREIGVAAQSVRNIQSRALNRLRSQLPDLSFSMLLVALALDANVQQAIFQFPH